MKKYIVLFIVLFFASTSFSDEEKVSITEAKKTSRNLGKVSVVKTEPNPEGQTRVFFESCSHPKIGKIRCDGWMYEVNEQGFLSKKSIEIDNNSSAQTIVLASGTYYIKMGSYEARPSRYGTGEFSVAPFVTNYLHVELE